MGAEGFGSIYLASDPVTALHEVLAVFGGHRLATYPWALVSVVGYVQHVLDLTDDAVLKALATSTAELTGEWRYSQARYLAGDGAMPPTQRLGRAAFDHGGIQGIRYRSAKSTQDGINLLVFPGRLAPGGAGFLEVYDPHTNLSQRIPPLP